MTVSLGPPVWDVNNFNCEHVFLYTVIECSVCVCVLYHVCVCENVRVCVCVWVDDQIAHHSPDSPQDGVRVVSHETWVCLDKDHGVFVFPF